MPDDVLPPTPAPDHNAQPFTFSALATKNLLRGELVTFYVDGNGRITADKLEMLSSTPRVAKVPQP